LQNPRGGAHDLAHLADAETGEAGSFAHNFAAEDALGLEAAELGDRFIKNTAGVGAGAVDGDLTAFGGFVIEGGEGGFDEAAATEPPHGAEDFLRQAFFHPVSGTEFGVEGLLQFRVERFFARADECGGEQARGDGIFRRGSLPCFADGAGGGLGVREVGGKLCVGGHGELLRCQVTARVKRFWAVLGRGD
jgi:hypothetical protein